MVCWYTVVSSVLVNPYISQNVDRVRSYSISPRSAEGGELNVNLQKMKKADTWPGALRGNNASVDPVTLEHMQKKIMLERFQTEVGHE